MSENKMYGDNVEQVSTIPGVSVECVTLHSVAPTRYGDFHVRSYPDTLSIELKLFMQKEEVGIVICTKEEFEQVNNYLKMLRGA